MAKVNSSAVFSASWTMCKHAFSLAWLPARGSQGVRPYRDGIYRVAWKLIVQEHAQEATGDRQRATVVGDKAELFELIHEMTHP